MDIKSNSFKNITELLQEKIARIPHKNVINFLNPDNSRETYTYQNIHDKALHIAGVIQEKCAKGSRILLLYPPSADFIIAFWSCIYAGVIPVPAPLPLKKGVFAKHLEMIINNCTPALCLTNSKTYYMLQFNKLENLFSDMPVVKTISKKIFKLNLLDHKFNLAHLPIILTDKVKIKPKCHTQIITSEPDDILFLQYTSGSTGDPKGVIITHKNMLANLKTIDHNFCINENTKTLIWMPPYYDMGLIGSVLEPMHFGYEAYIASPIAFIQDPLFWLEEINKSKITVSGGPNFAYDLCIRHYDKERLKSLDLSCWETAFCGAETIHYHTLKQFENIFSSHGFKKRSFLPYYGLAESTLYVAGIKNYNPDDAISVNRKDIREDKVSLSDADAGHCFSSLGFEAETKNELRLVSCGKGSSGQELKIVDENHHELPELSIGKIIIQSDSVGKGYWNNESITNNIFKYKIKNNPKNYFDTGDRGFLYQQHLYVMGREKELIIIHGKKHYPQLIEKSIQECSSLIRKNYIAVFQLPEISKDRIMMALEVYQHTLTEEDFKKIAINIFRHVLTYFELQIERIMFLPKNTLAKTTNGNIPRKIIAQQMINGELKPCFLWLNYAEDDSIITEQFDYQTFQSKDKQSQKNYVLDMVVNLVSILLQIDKKEIAMNNGITNYIADSLIQVDLMTRLEAHFGVAIPFTLMLNSHNISEFSDLLIKHINTNKKKLSVVPTADTLPLLPMQRFMLEKAGYNEFNLARVLDVPKHIQLQRLKESINSLVSCQPYLNSLLIQNQQNLILKLTSSDLYLIDEIYLDDQVSSSLKLTLSNILNNQSKLIDIRKGPLFSLTLCHLPENKQKIILVMSHFSSDPYSIRLFLQLLHKILYEKQLDAKMVMNKVMQEINYLADLFSPTKHIEEASLNYWRNRMEAQAIIAKEKWHTPHISNMNADEAVHSIKFTAILSQKIDNLIDRHNFDVDSVLLGAFLYSFFKLFHQNEYLIQIQHHGRIMPNHGMTLSNTITWLNISWPLILKINESKSLLESIFTIQDTIQDTKDHAYTYNISYYQSDEYKQLLIPPDWATIEYSNIGKLKDEKSTHDFTDCPLFANDYTHGDTFSHALKRYRQLFVRPHWYDNCLNMAIFYNKNLFSHEIIANMFESIHDNLNTVVA